jgi:hypothetical protein
MFINKQACLVSLTLPAGIYQTACVDNTTAPTLRAAIRKMFGLSLKYRSYRMILSIRTS